MIFPPLGCHVTPVFSAFLFMIITANCCIFPPASTRLTCRRLARVRSLSSRFPTDISCTRCVASTEETRRKSSRWRAQTSRSSVPVAVGGASGSAITSLSGTRGASGAVCRSSSVANAVCRTTGFATAYRSARTETTRSRDGVQVKVRSALPFSYPRCSLHSTIVFLPDTPTPSPEFQVTSDDPEYYETAPNSEQCHYGLFPCFKLGNLVVSSL